MLRGTVRHTMAQAKSEVDADLPAAELAYAREALRSGEVVRVLVHGTRKVALCTSEDDVRAAQRGRIPPDAVRLDRGRVG